ncbi:hypothetical protein V5O48_019125, partial [Marasmius crinis-equi]
MPANENDPQEPQGQEPGHPPPSPHHGPPTKKQKAFDSATAAIHKRKKNRKVRKKKKGAFTVKATDAVLSAAKWFGRHNTPELHFETVVWIGLRGSENWKILADACEDDELVIENDEGEEDPFPGQCLDAFKRLIKEKPLFSEYLDHCAARAAEQTMTKFGDVLEE